MAARNMRIGAFVNEQIEVRAIYDNQTNEVTSITINNVSTKTLVCKALNQLTGNFVSITSLPNSGFVTTPVPEGMLEYEENDVTEGGPNITFRFSIF